MKSQKLGAPIGISSSDSDKEDILCYHHPSYMFNRDTYQMSPLLFESDTEDTSQSTDIKCYQQKTITPPVPATPNNLQIFDLLSTLTDLRNKISSQPSSQHNQCCSETLLNSSNHRTTIDTKVNTNNAYISPSPRVTRLKVLKSRILTRSAKRLHKISELCEYSESPKNSRKTRRKKDVSKERKSSPDGKNSKSKAGDKETNEEMLIESIKNSKVRVVLERLKFPFFQNPHQVKGTFIQPDIVPNMEIDDVVSDLDFLNRRLSSEVQMFTEIPAVISISSESTTRNQSTPPPGSPDLFENFERSSVSNICSQNSFDIPNGQILMSSPERRISETLTSTPNTPNNSTLVPSIFDIFDRDCATPDINAARDQLLSDEDKKRDQQHTFEITVNEVFDNVIHVADSEDTLTPQRPNPVDECRTAIENNKPQSEVTRLTRDNLDNLLDLAKYMSSQEVTPKKRPEIRGLLNKSLGACPSNESSTLNRSKWLSKPRSSNSDSDPLNRTTQRCRRLDLWFQNERETKARPKGEFSKLLLTSSEEEDS